FNKYNIQYVFCDFEEPSRVGFTRSTVDQVQHSTMSKSARIGNFNFYPNSTLDPTRPGAVTTIAESYDDPPVEGEYLDSHANMANEALYPCAPDFRNPANGNSNAPNIRSALFVLPIIRDGFVTTNLK